jgi:putative aldouronate transport system permease protein
MLLALNRKKKYEINSISSITNISFNIIATAICLACILPFILVISVSLSDSIEVMKVGYKFLPVKFTLAGYKFLFQEPSSIINGYVIQIGCTIVGTILSIIITGLYSFPLSRPEFHFKRFFSVLIIIPMLFSGGMMATYAVYTQWYHFTNNLLVYVLPSCFGIWTVFLLRTFFSITLPQSIIEAARIDGAADWTLFFKIVIPLSKPIIATIALFTGLMYWNDWFTALLYMDNSKYFNIQYLMSKTVNDIMYLTTIGNGSSRAAEEIAKLPTESVRMAMCIIGMGPILLVYPFLQKYFVKGLTEGGVKG